MKEKAIKVIIAFLIFFVTASLALVLIMSGDDGDYKNDGYYETTREEFEFQISNAYENTDRFYKLLERGNLTDNEVDFVSTVLDLNINAVTIVALEEGKNLRGRFLDYATKLRELIDMDVSKLNKRLESGGLDDVKKYRQKFLKEYKKFEREGRG